MSRGDPGLLGPVRHVLHLPHPCRTLDFDTIMGAIGTNAPPRCKDVVMQFMRPADAQGPEAVDKFLEFFEVPLDHVFRKN